MFQAVALAALAGLGLGANDALLRIVAREQRAVVARVLASPGSLLVEGSRLVDAPALLRSAAATERLPVPEYLERLRREGRDGGLHGGGPELTVLSNLLRRPISVYEVADDENDRDDDAMDSSVSPDTCRIVCKGVFGREAFHDPLLELPDSAVLSDSLQQEFSGAYSWHIHILVVDTAPGEKHACVLLPLRDKAFDPVTDDDTDPS